MTRRRRKLRTIPLSVFVKRPHCGHGEKQPSMPKADINLLALQLSKSLGKHDATR